MINMDEIKGKAKQEMGKITNNSRQQAEGRAMELEGKAKAKVNEMKDDIQRKDT
jgi:uncharacterized protein YjbJ (UPF0337 family)